MLPVANVQTTGPQIAPYGVSPSQHSLASCWTGAYWIDSDERDPDLLAELGIPLRCFHAERGYFFACFLPERGWYWASDAMPVRPERWALPMARSGRRSLAF